MAELDEIVQKVLLDGDLEVINKLQEIGERGGEALTELAEIAEKGAGNFTVLTTGIALAASAIAGLAGAVTAFVESNTEAIQATNFLAEAFGTTTEKINAIESAFAQAGVSTKQFEQFAQRLTVTIAREWPQIAENIRTASDEQAAAQNRVVAATIRVQEAQQNLQLVSERSGSAIANAALREEEALTKLRFAAQEAYSTIISDLNNVASANLSVEAAEQRLATLQGRPPSDAEKKSLELREAQLALDKAREAEADALRKQQQDQAEAANKQAKLEQEAADAALRHETAVNEAAVARQKAELAVKEAVIARSEAEERAAQVALKSIPAITDALKEVVNGNKDVAKSFDFSQVSVRNMVNAIIDLAAEGGKVPPPGFKVMQTLMQLLHNDTEHQIDAQQRLAIVQQLSQRGFASTSSAAFELLAALERGSGFFQKFEDSMKGFTFTSEDAKAKVQEFRDALTLLTNSIDNVNRDLAAAAAPAFTEMLKAITESLRSSDGLLHQFVDGVKGIAEVVGFTVEQFKTLFVAIDAAFNAPAGTTFKVLLTFLLGAVAAFTSAWLAIPAAIAVVTLAIGLVKENMDAIKQKIEEHRLAFIATGAAIAGIIAFLAPIPVAIGLIIAGVVLVYDNWNKVKEVLGDILSPITNIVKKMVDLWNWATKIGEVIAGWFKGGKGSPPAPAAPASGSEGGEGNEGTSQGFASGGHVRGPGTGTSDSIPAMLSDGEFVMRSAAVQKFGVGFMHALNNMMLPGFATGGLVGAPARLGSPSSMQASRPLNLSIDGRSFPGLRGPKNVVDSLASYAVSRQTSSAGQKPSWVR